MADSNTDRTEAPDDRLATRLLSPDTFEHFIADCQALVASEIKKKGMTLRTAFRLVQKVKPDIVDRTVRELMPQFIHAIEPRYADFRAQRSDDLRAYLSAHDAEVADAMLTVTDRRAEKIYSRTIRSAYERVRGRARREIIDAMPGIATTIARHA